MRADCGLFNYWRRFIHNYLQNTPPTCVVCWWKTSMSVGTKKRWISYDDDVLTTQGSGLDTECMKSAVIMVGVELCNKTTVVNDELLQCTPPSQQPRPRDSSHQLPRVVVRSLTHTTRSTVFIWSCLLCKSLFTILLLCIMSQAKHKTKEVAAYKFAFKFSIKQGRHST